MAKIRLLLLSGSWRSPGLVIWCWGLLLWVGSLGKLFKGPDLATTVLKSAPGACNIFVVSRRKLTMKFAGQSVMGGPNIDTQIQSVSRRAFCQREWKCIFNKNTSSYSLLREEKLQLFRQSDTDAYSQICEDDNDCTTSGGTSETSSVLCYNGGYKASNFGKSILEGQTFRNYENPFIILHPTTEVEPPAEVVRLRLELQNTLAMYKRACEDLVQARQMVKVISAECSEEEKKVKDALERERVLQKFAEEERAKHLEVMKQVQEARQLLAKEALDRREAEKVASEVSTEKNEVVDALFSNGSRCRRYSKNEIEVATDNFSDFKKIGEGSYGNVYKCNLDHIPVAVKVLHQNGHEKNEEFLREVEVLTQLRHPHMLLLLGVCPESGCLVYEYMENGSLEDQLFHREGSPPLPWFIRFRIIFEVACGLAFLHGNKPEPVVHRDLKPGNILLDRNYVSKIGDVGLAKLLSDVVPDGLTEYKETLLAGTLYYMDPEYQRTGTLRPKSDLYALGIIALQLLTARHPQGLLMAVENAIKGGFFADLLDKTVIDWPLIEAEKLGKLALKCSRLRCRERPDLELEILPELEEILNMADVSFNLRQCNVYAPSHYICPILQEVMDNPHIAADGYTYEYTAIKAWLGKHRISPVTRLKLPHTCIIPNYSLRSAIQEWKMLSLRPSS
ncbi:U-box domain-containing protein 34 isoform X1 [Iris pallida]|uniref:RING-type E3 ubiquitin transferase n=1 Tax=Iris pallida TaxID=29817 RepID=A0AAX6HHX5_IRIPA|nr:U-box domain-containing protein 34 isoform X1 [Iris pallida]